MPTNKQQLLRKIEDLEEQLSNLKLELQQELQEESEDDESTFNIGDRVRILNPKKGQPSRGRIIKLHPKSQRATVLTKFLSADSSGIEIKTVCMLKNLKKE